MAQMFQGLNYKSWNGREEGYNAWLKNHGIKYAFNMMLEEIRVLSKLEVRDEETFIERSSFFTKEVIAKTMEDYMAELKGHIDAQRTYMCKGVPYKKVRGKDIFVVDLDKKIYAPMRWDIAKVGRARSYSEIYKIVSDFTNKMISVPYNTMVYGLAAVSYLNRRLKEYQGEGWRMFALMKKVIADNNFDFKARMNEIYGK